MSEGREVVLGLLLLETRFPRLPGDIGHPSTFPFPLRHAVVRGATPGRVVREAAEGLLDAFIEAGRGLAREGVAGIVTSCGFLVLHQAALAEGIGLPVATSSLLQVPLVQSLLPPGKCCGILTIDSASLTPAHLAAAGITTPMPIAGMAAGGHFAEVFLGDVTELDPERAEAEIIAATRGLLRREPGIGALVLECTNMGPYAAAIGRPTGLPVFDVRSLVSWFVQGLHPPAAGCP